MNEIWLEMTFVFCSLIRLMRTFCIVTGCAEVLLSNDSFQTNKHALMPVMCLADNCMGKSVDSTVKHCDGTIVP